MVGAPVLTKRSLLLARDVPPGTTSVPPASRRVAPRDREKPVELRSRLFWPAWTVYVPAALVALLKGVIVTKPPLSRKTMRLPPASVTGAEKVTVTLIGLPRPYAPLGVVEVTLVIVGSPRKGAMAAVRL